MDRVHLNAKLIDRIPIPTTGQTFVRDDEAVGLSLRITPNGARSFVYEGRMGGRVRRFTLGGYPALTVLAARTKVHGIKGKIADGLNPAEERKQERELETFKEIATAYLKAKKEKRSLDEDQRRIDAHLIPRFGSRRMADITPADARNLLHKIGAAEEGGHPIEANRVVVLLRGIFNWAIKDGKFDGDNPAAQLDLFKEKHRKRFLLADEFKRVSQALRDEPAWRDYFLLLTMLGPRRSELLGARWSDVDLNEKLWNIPITKSVEPHQLPLPRAAVQIIEKLPSRGKSEWLFPAKRSKSGHLEEPAKAWGRIRTAAGVPDVRIHDLRRTLGSWMAAEGFSLPMIGRARNHSSVNTTQIYAKIDVAPVRAALEQTSRAMIAATKRKPRGRAEV